MPGAWSQKCWMFINKVEDHTHSRMADFIGTECSWPHWRRPHGRERSVPIKQAILEWVVPQLYLCLNNLHICRQELHSCSRCVLWPGTPGYWECQERPWAVHRVKGENYRHPGHTSRRGMAMCFVAYSLISLFLALLSVRTRFQEYKGQLHRATSNYQNHNTLPFQH